VDRRRLGGSGGTRPLTARVRTLRRVTWPRWPGFSAASRPRLWRGT
jgi:hypothetical protein